MYGHTVGACLAIGYLENPTGFTADWLTAGEFEIEIANVRVPATASLRSFYDPASQRVRM